MDLTSLIELLSPIVAGFAGIISALFVFVSAIRTLKGLFKSALTENSNLRKEILNVRKELTDLKQQTGYLVEKEKRNDKK